MKNFILALSTLLFSSCMHLTMMGTGADHQSAPESVFEKEITVGGVRISIIFPALVREEEVLVTMRLADYQTGQAISGAEVSFHAEYLHSSAEQMKHGHDMMEQEKDSTKAHQMDHDHQMNLDQRIEETAAGGNYAFRFRPSQSGEYRFAIHITALRDQILDPAIVIEATRNVHEKMSAHGGSMHGLGGASPYVIVGASIMGAMMVIIWLTRGGIF